MELSPTKNYPRTHLNINHYQKINSDKFFRLRKNFGNISSCLGQLLLLLLVNKFVTVNAQEENVPSDLSLPTTKELFNNNYIGNNSNEVHSDQLFNHTSIHQPYQLMSLWGYVFSAMFLFVIWIMGSAGNFLVIYLVCTNRQLQTPMNLFLVNLSIADFTMAALGSPVSFVSAVLGGWPFGDTVCTIYAFGMALGGITSITTLMVLAFERFMMIARPFRAADIQNQHSAAFIAAIWLYSLALTVPPLIGWASYGPEAAFISCSVNWEDDNLGTTTYIVFLFAMGLVLPLFTIIISYCGILFTIRQTAASQAASTTRRAELRVIGMVATMVTSFFVAWSPYAIVSLLVAFSPTYRQEITGFLAVLPSIFAKSSSCYNPIIYVGLNTQFRTAWLNLLGIERPRDEDGATGAVTMSATIGIPKSPQVEDIPLVEQKGNVDSKTNAESSFIIKHNRRKSQYNSNSKLDGGDGHEGNTPLLEREKNKESPFQTNESSLKESEQEMSKVCSILNTETEKRRKSSEDTHIPIHNNSDLSKDRRLSTSKSKLERNCDESFMNGKHSDVKVELELNVNNGNRAKTGKQQTHFADSV